MPFCRKSLYRTGLVLKYFPNSFGSFGKRDPGHETLQTSEGDKRDAAIHVLDVETVHNLVLF